MVHFSGLMSVVALGLALALAARMLASDGGEPSASARLLHVTAIILLAIGLLGVCLITTGNLGFVIWPIAMTIVARAAMHRRAAQKRSLLAALMVAIDRRMPLAPMVLAFANEQEGAFAGRARALAERLEQGEPVETVLVRSRRVLPPESALAAEVGRQSGDLLAALRASGTDSQFERTLLQPALSRTAYLMFMVIGMIAMGLYVQMYLAPWWTAILNDFDMNLSTALPMAGPRWLTDAIDTLSGWLLMRLPVGMLWVFFSLTSFLLLAIMGCLLMLLLCGYVWLQWRGTLKPRLPFVRTMINWVDTGGVLRLPALSAAANRPLVGTLSAVARLHPKRSVRSRMRRVVNDVNNGIAWHQGLRRRRLIGADDAAFLAAASDTGNLSWALEEMASSFERRASHRVAALSQGVLPLFILPLGMVTCLFTVTCLAPLARLAEELSR